MKLRERGGGLLIVVLLLITAGAFAAVIAASQSGGDIKDTDNAADSIQALFLAETGVERALKRFATGTACGALAEPPITNLASIGLGTTAYEITIGAGFTSGFAGLPLVSSETQCRVPVTGRVIATNVSRTIHAIVDRNLLPGPNNHNFNNTLIAPDAAWTRVPVASFQNNGGPDGGFPNCYRSAWLVKTTAVATAVNASGTTTMPAGVTVASPSTTTVYFHRRVVDRGAHATCVALAPAPAFICALAAGQASTVCFRLTTSGAGSPFNSTLSNFAPLVNIGAVACPHAPNPCSTNYNPDVPIYPAKRSVTIAIAGGAATRTVTAFAYSMRLQNANQREIFLDNLEAVNTTALNAARVQVWRDCSGAANPVTCL